MSGGQEVKPLSVLRTKITSETSLPSCLLFLCSSDCYPLPIPPPGEGVCAGWSGYFLPSLEGRGSKGVGAIEKTTIICAAHKNNICNQPAFLPSVPLFF